MEEPTFVLTLPRFIFRDERISQVEFSELQLLRPRMNNSVYLKRGLILNIWCIPSVSSRHSLVETYSSTLGVSKIHAGPPKPSWSLEFVDRDENCKLRDVRHVFGRPVRERYVAPDCRLESQVREKGHNHASLVQFDSNNPQSHFGNLVCSVQSKCK